MNQKINELKLKQCKALHLMVIQWNKGIISQIDLRIKSDYIKYWADQNYILLLWILSLIEDFDKTKALIVNCVLNDFRLNVKEMKDLRGCQVAKSHQSGQEWVSHLSEAQAI